ncbi:MAG: tetratricopeptide repeat protein [Candidatus Marinimicrobia bacterium]|nr:tetratricopeptide repeat protein [Candidatus Neomarinimicrobiota bacterium]
MRIKINHLILFVTLLMASLVYGVDAEGLMATGNRHYEQGDIDLAIQSYESLLAADVVSTALHYNLGCAYFNQKSYGKAILQFEKARQLSPRDPDILHNLEFSKLFLKDRFDLPEPMPLVAWMGELHQSTSLTELQILELIFFVLLIFGVVVFRLIRGRPMAAPIFGITLVTGLLFLLTGGWLVDRTLSLGDKHAVLLSKEAEVSSAPIPGSSTLFVIHEGTSGEILDATDNWYEIRLVDGKTGWVKNEAVGIY